MALTVIERVKLAKELALLMAKVKTDKGLEKVRTVKEITAVMQKLGITGKKAAVPSGEDTGTGTEELPAIVRDFLDGKFTDKSQGVFIAALREIKEYVGPGLSVDSLKPMVIAWAENSGMQLS